VRLIGLIIAIPLLAACAHTPAGQSSASCTGPYLDDQPPTGSHGAPAPTVGPGDDLTIYGHWYTSTCNDTGSDHDPLTVLPPEAVPGGRALVIDDLHHSYSFFVAAN
jgi:hypothetical protein